MVLAVAAIFMTLFTVEWALAVPLFAAAFVAQQHPLKALALLLVYCVILLLVLFNIYGWPRLLTPETWTSPWQQPHETRTRPRVMKAFSQTDSEFSRQQSRVLSLPSEAST